jgi:hypothetical protein
MHNGRMFRMVFEFAIACGFCLLAVLFAPLSLWRDLGQTGGSLLAVVVAVTVTGSVWLRHARAPLPAEASQARLLGPAE